MISLDSLSQKSAPYRAGYNLSGSGIAVADRVGQGQSAKTRTIQLVKFIDFTFQVDAPTGSPTPVSKTIEHGYGGVPFIILTVNVDGEYVNIPGNFGANEIIFSNARQVTDSSFTVYATSSTVVDYTLLMRAHIFKTPLL